MTDNIRTNCKWMEVFENYEENKRYLCHLTIDSKYVKLKKYTEFTIYFQKSVTHEQ